MRRTPQRPAPALVLAGLLAAVLAAGVAHAQVAVPELAPAAPRYYDAGTLGFNSATLTADNPAALQWGMPSRVAFGLIELEEQTTAGTTRTSEFSGNYVGGRGVWEGWALGAEHLAVDEDAPGEGEETATSVHLAFRVLDALALGAGVDQAEASSGTASNEIDSTTFGAAVNVDDQFYVGYALSQDTFEDSAGTSADRDASMLGFGVRIESDWRWHFAYDVLDKDPFDDPNPFGGFEATTLTGQVLAGELLVGVQRVEVDDADGGDAFEATVFDVGWVPESGLTLTGRLADGETTAGAGGVQRTHDHLSVSVGYLF